MEPLGVMLLLLGLFLTIGSVGGLFATDDALFIIPTLCGVVMVFCAAFVLESVTKDEHRKECKQYATGLKLQSEWNKDQGCLLILPDGRKIKDEYYKVGG